MIKKQKKKVIIKDFNLFSIKNELLWVILNEQRRRTPASAPCTTLSRFQSLPSHSPPPVVKTFCSRNVVGDNYIMMVDGGEWLGLEETRQRDLRGQEIYVLSWKPNNNNNNNNNIREQHTRKLWSQGTTENSHIGHCTHTSESTNVKVQ